MTITLLFLTLFLLQTTAGEIIVTLQDADENPVIGETIEFWPESSISATGSCITDENGTCTITVNAPVNASGFIRGSITFFNGNGKRPVIWPGSTLELTLTLDEKGEFNTNSDAYVTRTPEEKIDSEEEKKFDSEEEKEKEKEETTTPTQEFDSEKEKTTTPTQENLDTLELERPAEEHETPIEAFIFRGFFIFLLVCTLIFYIWKNKQ